jgi:hypothetical protein
MKLPLEGQLQLLLKLAQLSNEFSVAGQGIPKNVLLLANCCGDIIRIWGKS